MSEIDNPITKKEAAERAAASCRHLAEKMRDGRSELRLTHREYRKDHGLMSAVDISVADGAALRRFLISHLEERAARFDREANRLRFEAILWSEHQAEKMRAEIAEFNARHLK